MLILPQLRCHGFVKWSFCSVIVNNEQQDACRQHALNVVANLVSTRKLVI
jgi:hypothetical protein